MQFALHQEAWAMVSHGATPRHLVFCVAASVVEVSRVAEWLVVVLEAVVVATVVVVLVAMVVEVMVTPVVMVLLVVGLGVVANGVTVDIAGDGVVVGRSVVLHV